MGSTNPVITKVNWRILTREGRRLDPPIKSSRMPKGLVRYQELRITHFITFSCYRGVLFWLHTYGYNTFEHGIGTLRAKYEFTVPDTC